MGLMNLTFQANLAGSEGLDNRMGTSKVTGITKKDCYNDYRSYSFIDYCYNWLTEEEYKSFLRNNTIRPADFNFKEFLKVKSDDYMKAISCYRKFYYNNYLFPIRNDDSIIKEAKRLVNMYFAFLEAVYLHTLFYPATKDGDHPKIFSYDTYFEKMKLYKILFKSCDSTQPNTFYGIDSQIRYQDDFSKLRNYSLRKISYSAELIWLFEQLKVEFENLKNHVESIESNDVSNTRYKSLVLKLSKEFNTLSSFHLFEKERYLDESLRTLKLDLREKIILLKDIKHENK